MNPRQRISRRDLLRSTIAAGVGGRTTTTSHGLTAANCLSWPVVTNHRPRLLRSMLLNVPKAEHCHGECGWLFVTRLGHSRGHCAWEIEDGAKAILNRGSVVPGATRTERRFHG